MANELIQRLVDSPILYRDQRVITLRMMDEAHERPDGTAGRNFRENRRRLLEGEDYFEVPYDEWRQWDTVTTNFVATEYRGSLILLTESGYLLLVKSFRDDLAWNVQRSLVSVYFRAKQSPPPSPVLLTAQSFAACLSTCEHVLTLGGMEDRDRVLLKDFARDGLLVITGKHLQPPCAVALVVSNRCVELGYPRPKQGQEKQIGKCIARLYRAKHGKNPAHRLQHVDGAVRSVNHYTMEDIDVVDAGIRDYFDKASEN
jgi:hypothetical protein